MQRLLRPEPLPRRRIAKNENLILIKNGIRIDAICEYCHGSAGWDTFRSQLNVVEYNLTGYCQACQDEVPGDLSGRVPKNLRSLNSKKVSGFKSGGKVG